MIEEEALLVPAGVRWQQTLARPAQINGVGYLSGAAVRLRFLPAPPNQGVVFIRTDLSPPLHLPATIQQVTSSQRRTTLGLLPRGVTLVEHVLAALAGLRIDNCFVELNAPEPPGLDGSARRFVEELRTAGTRVQYVPKTIWKVTRSLILQQHGASLALHPQPGMELRISYFLNYGDFSAVGRQHHSTLVEPGRFCSNLAGCRTFLLEAEARELQRQGIGRHAQVSDLLVYGRQGPIGNVLRFADEPARHKILDLIGDLSLLGEDVRGHLVACRSGHPLNAELVRQLAQHLGEKASACRQAA